MTSIRPGDVILVHGTTLVDKVMQPLSNPAGQLDDYPYALMAAVDQSDCVEIDMVLPKDGGTPITPTDVLAKSVYTLASGATVTVP
jgi:hypothetical protein